MFLVDKIPKDNISSPDKDETSKKNVKKMPVLIAQKLNLMLEQCWTPSFCKRKGLRFVDANTILKEGCKNVETFETILLAIPNSKNKYSKGTLDIIKSFLFSSE